MLLGAAQRSYRQTVRVFNRSRRQENRGTPLNTLCDVVHGKGLKVLDFLARQSLKPFRRHGFDATGLPAADLAPASFSLKLKWDPSGFSREK